MRSKYIIITLVLVTSTFLYNCSEVQDEITQAPILEGVHPDGFAKLGSQDFHGTILKARNWDMSGCKSCHASDFSGGLSGTSCNDCHTQANGPEACNTCHGVFADETKIAPPRDLDNNFETTAKGVGAHTTHIYENELSLPLGCFDCHSGDFASGNFVTAHIDGLPAEMKLDGYNQSELTCSNTYCHGNFEFKKDDVEEGFEYIHKGEAIVGENFSPKWNQVDGTQAACGTCHLMPPRGHLLEGSDPDGITCSSNNCHPSAYNEDGSLNIYNHANGEKNLN
ncbi:MAG: hypothetical protein KDC88_04535 [Ignavibacteriae bacterium]|nr:hypothetical protein [Ignavibacteriota bacterium]MCB9209198.1 hypothetical protein [Ignavibacteriales bacterium]MCB9219552.1 hypothetical protein [Ignavibacteriales bacterium]MCB9257846.1 hypothetical protein [Ignavibacteriales bacterium]